MAYALVTEQMTEPDRFAFDERLMSWRASPDAVLALPVPTMSRADAIASWGTQPEAESALNRTIAQMGLVTA